MYCHDQDYQLEKYMQDHRKEAEDLIAMHIRDDKVRKAFIDMFKVTYGFEESNPLIKLMNLEDIHLAALDGDLNNYEVHLKEYFFDIKH